MFRTNLQYCKTIEEQLEIGGKIGILVREKKNNETFRFTFRNFLLPTVALQSITFFFVLPFSSII